MRPLRTIAILLVMPLALAACADGVLAPDAAADPVAAAQTDAARSTADTYVPLLTRLIDNAVAELRQQNPTEASRIASRQRSLAQDAARALSRGDQASHDAALGTADVEGSVAVMRILGQPILRRVLLSVSTDLPLFKRRIAAAQGTRQTLDWMTPVVQRAARLEGAADGASSSDPALALRLSAQAFDLLAILPR